MTARRVALALSAVVSTVLLGLTAGTAPTGASAARPEPPVAPGPTRAAPGPTTVTTVASAPGPAVTPVEEERRPRPLWVGAVVGGGAAAGLAFSLLRSPRRGPETEPASARPD